MKSGELPSSDQAVVASDGQGAKGIPYSSRGDHRFGQIATGSTIPTDADWKALGFEGPPEIKGAKNG